MTVSINFQPHPAQAEIYQCPARFRTVRAGRRFGKSHLALAEAMIAAQDTRNTKKLPVWIVCPTHPGAKDIYFQKALNEYGALIENSNSNEGRFDLINGVQLHLKGADRPETLRGPGLWFAVLDEAGDLKPVVWEVIVSPMLIDAVSFGGGRSLIIGSPKPGSAFSDLHKRAMAGDDPNWKGFEFQSSDNPYLSDAALQTQQSLMSAAAFRQEIEGSEDASETRLFKREWFKYGTEPKDGSYYIAVDLAGFDDPSKSAMLKGGASRLDEHAICVVKASLDSAGCMTWFVKDVVHGRWDVNETARRIVDAIEHYQPVGFGIEVGTAKNAIEPALRAGMRRRSAIAAIHSLSHDNKSKTDRVVWALQGKFEHGLIVFDIQGRYTRSLEDQLLHFGSRGVHDDMVDALSYINKLVINVVSDDWIDDTPSEWSEVLDALTGY